MANCAFCGRESAPSETPNGSASHRDELPLTWVTSVENDQVRVYCDECARSNLRSIESKLDSEWW
jgi:hypothetical protein